MNRKLKAPLDRIFVLAQEDGNVFGSFRSMASAIRYVEVNEPSDPIVYEVVKVHYIVAPEEPRYEAHEAALSDFVSAE